MATQTSKSRAAGAGADDDGATGSTGSANSPGEHGRSTTGIGHVIGAPKKRSNARGERE
jgi:hypothetical protein